MDSKYKLIIDSFGKDRFKFNEPLKEYTASELGGPAKLFFIAFTESDLIRIIIMCKELKIPFFLFGTGSKILISDLGFEGLVIKNRTKNIQTISVKGKVTKYGIGVDEALVEAEGGVSINKLVEYLNSQDLETDAFRNTQGSIGGNLFLNRFLQNHTKSIKVLDRKSEIVQISVENLKLKEHIILSAVLKMKARR